MIKKILFTLSISTVALMALDSGDTIPSLAIQKLSLQKNKIYIIDFLPLGVTHVKKSYL